MFRQLWAQIVQLKTPERRLLIGGLFCAVIVLWLSLKGSNTEQVAELKLQVKNLNAHLDKITVEAAKKLEIKQDQLDACRSEGLMAAQKRNEMLEAMIRRADSVTQRIKAAKAD